MASQSKSYTMFGLIRSIITHFVPPPKVYSPSTSSVEDIPLADANTSHDDETNDDCTKEEEETYRAQLWTMYKSALILKVDADTADTDSMSDSIRNGQVDLEWEQRKGNRRTRRRGGPQFSAAADAFRSELQEFHFAKRQEEQRLKQKEKDLDDYLKAALERMAELDGMVAIRRDLVTKADKEQAPTKQADTKHADNHDRGSACVNSRAEELGGNTQSDIALLKTQYEDLSKKSNGLQNNEGGMKNDLEANKKFCHELRGRIYVLENSIAARQAKVPNSEAVATPIAGTEQPQATTRGYDPKEVRVLTTKTEGHDQQIKRLETAVSDISPKMKKAFAWHEWAGEKFEAYDKHLAEVNPNTLKAIEASKEQQDQHFNEAFTKQTEAFENQLRQQKEESDKELSNQRESMQEAMRLYEASIRKECDERLASKDKEVAERLAKIDSEQKEQKERNDTLEKTMNDFIAQIKAQNAVQQSPSPAQGQQQPKAPAFQPTAAPRGNEPWPSTSTLSNQGFQQRFPRNGAETGRVGELDDPMMEAPPLNPQQVPLQPPRQPAQPKFEIREDTPMDYGEPMIPNNNGNARFLPDSQPMGGNQLFSGTGPVQPPSNAPIPSPAPAHGHMSTVWSSSVPTGFDSSTPFSTLPATPSDKGGARLQSSLFQSGAPGPKTLAGQMSLPSLTATPARAPASQKFDLNTPPPNWSSYMDLDGDDAMTLPAKPEQPSINDALATPLPVQQAASTPAPTIANNNGPSSSVSGPSSTPAKPQAPAHTKPSVAKPKKTPDLFNKRKLAANPSKSNNVTNKVQTTKTPAASLAEKRQAAFAANYSSFGPDLTPPKMTVEKTASPSEGPSAFHIPGLTGAVNTSPFAMKPKTPAPEPAPSPAFTPMTPAAEPAPPASASPTPVYKPATPAVRPRTSPLANSAATSDTIASPSTTNIFTKEVRKPVKQPSEGNGYSTPGEEKVEDGHGAATVAQPAKPANSPHDIQMSAAESKPDDTQMSESENKPEPTMPLKYEVDVNPRKHAAAAQIVPQDDAKTVKRETQDDAKAHKGNSQGNAEVEMGGSLDEVAASKQDCQGDDHMETDRRVAKPKGKASKMTAAERKRETDKFQQEASWDEMEKALAWGAAQKEKAAAAAADDEVDYGDPDDVNHEDFSKTTMAAPLPKVRPIKYSIAFFNEWRQHFMSVNSLSSKAAGFECKTKEDFETFANAVQKQDAANDLGHLLVQAALPLKETQGYTRYEMEKLLFTYREEVYFNALFFLDLNEMDEDFQHTHERFKADMVSWFRTHLPDAI